MFGLSEVRRCASRREANQLALVLTARGIESQIIPTGRGVVLCVSSDEAHLAEAEIAAYEQENAAPRRPAASALRLRPQGGALETAMAYITAIVFVFAAQNRGAFGLDWMAAGAAHAGAIRDGEIWRAITALTLHADVEHLLSNVAFGGVAGGLAVQSVGAGVGWLAIVAAGALANLLNAWLLQTPGDVSVGASTAVFAALGLLAGHSQRAASAADPWRRGLRRFAPAAAGVLLLAFLGFGEGRVDVGAHVLGFAVGLGMGLALWRAPAAWFAWTRQLWAGAAAPGVVALAWLVAAGAG